jgi:adenosylmethionine-8-amino-7-oxononanoate aminotransferase
VTAYRISMQAICRAEQAEAIAEYLQVIPGFYTIAKPQKLERGQARIDFSIVVREEVQEENLMLRSLGETLVLTPPLVISEAQIGEVFDKLGRLIQGSA